MEVRTIVFAIMLLVLGWHTYCTDGVLSAIACQYIKQLIVQFKENKGKQIVPYHYVLHWPIVMDLLYTGRGFSGVIADPTPPFGKQETTEDYFHLPAVLLWNPMVTHPHFINQELSKCHYCGLPVHEGHWNDGSSSSTQPWTLNGISKVVLLVSAVYMW